MRVAGGQPLGFVLRAVGRERREPSADAFARRAVHADSVLWKQENEGVADNRRLCREPQAYLALVGFDGARSRVSEAEAERAWRRPPDLPLLVARNHGGARQPGMEHGYHLYPDGTRIPVPGCSDGLVQPVDAELVAVVDDGWRYLTIGRRWDLKSDGWKHIESDYRDLRLAHG